MQKLKRAKFQRNLSMPGSREAQVPPMALREASSFQVHFHLTVLMTLETSSVQTFDPDLPSNGLHLESAASLPKSFELRPMTTQMDGNLPFFISASVTPVSVSIKQIKPASPARVLTTG